MSMRNVLLVWAMGIAASYAGGCSSKSEKPAEVKPAEAKPAETKPAETKPAEPKPAESKPAETKPATPAPAATPKPEEKKPEAPKPAAPVTEAKPATPAPVATPKPAEMKPAAPAVAAKPAEPKVTPEKPATPPPATPKPAEKKPAPQVASTAGTPAAGGAKASKVMLGDPSLTTGIPGWGDLTVAEIRTWLDNPQNHVTLEVVLPLGLAQGQGDIKGLKENPLTRAKIELGRQLYFDPRLSKDATISCASCHSPSAGFAAHTRFGIGVSGQEGGRNSPVSYNRILSDKQFWDGRAASLEEQAKGPIANPIEMSNTHEACLTTIQGLEGYRIQFQKIFGDKITIDHVAQAIASFERVIVTGPTPFDHLVEWENYSKLTPDDLADDADLRRAYDHAKSALMANPISASAKRGRDLYFGKAQCATCHVGPNLTDEKYHNIGVGMKGEKPDLGRFEVTKDDKDRGAFKTPTIRNVVASAPYMHDGSVATLLEVVDFYDRGGEANPNLDDKVKKLNLTADEKKDLVAFMEACTGDFPKIERGRLPKK